MSIPSVRRFHLLRVCDPSGVSGIGEGVAIGCEMPNGECVLHWVGAHSSTNFYHSIEDLEYIHGHNGSTKIIWDDPPQQEKNKTQ